MMQSLYRLRFSLVLLVLLLNACKSREKLVYFQNGENSNSTVSSLGYNPVIKVDDFLSITVMSDDPKLSEPFNLPLSQGSANNISGYNTGNASLLGYLVDVTGEIHLPILGKMRVAGLSRSELVSQLEQKLMPYLSRPVVHVQIQNYKITVLGDVRIPGTFRIPNERITILEAIGLAGDLKPTGERKNVLVVRDLNGVKTEYRIDLTDKSLFQSPVYYLSQNDVVYVEPNLASRYESTVLRITAPILLSVTSLILTTINLLTK